MNYYSGTISLDWDPRSLLPHSLKEWYRGDQILAWTLESISAVTAGDGPTVSSNRTAAVSRSMTAPLSYRATRPGQPRVEQEPEARAILAVMVYSYACGILSSSEITSSAPLDPTLAPLCDTTNFSEYDLMRLRRQARSILHSALCGLLGRALHFRFHGDFKSASSTASTLDDQKLEMIVDQKLNEAVALDHVFLDD